MIYLDFSKKLQVIHIPKNGDYTGKIEDKPTFDEGYDKGYQDGLEDCECPPCEECKVEDYNININSNIEEHYASDYGLDGFSKVRVVAIPYGENRYKQGYDKGYDKGYNQGKSECGECPECNVGFKYHIVKDDTETINASEFGYDGFSEVEIYAAEYGNKKYEEGYNQGKSEGGEGGSCNISRLEEEIDVSNEGHIVRYAVDYGVDGWSYLDLDVNQYGNRKYNQGYEQGKSECGECPEYKEGDLNVEWNPIWGNNLWYASSEGLDGYRSVWIKAEKALQEKYNEGYEQGKSECPELTELNVVENGTYEGSFNKVNVTVNATDFSSEQVENKYSNLAFITKNISDSTTVIDKTKLTDRFGDYIQNGSINITQFKNGICLAMDVKYLNPDFNTGCVVRKIEDGAIDWNKVEELRTYTILEFGENMTRDKSSNIRSLYIYASTLRNETVIFNDGCFATSDLLQKIVFEAPFNVVVKGNPFEGFDSWGRLIVKGEEGNRSKYTDLINLLPSGWEVIFDPYYEE